MSFEPLGSPRVREAVASDQRPLRVVVRGPLASGIGQAGPVGPHSSHGFTRCSRAATK